MKSKIGPLLFVLVVIAGLGYWYWQYQTADRTVPEADTRLAELLPESQFINASTSEDFYREQITKQPDVVKNYIALSQLMMQRARETADEQTYIPQAQDLLEEALLRDPDNYYAHVLNASLQNTLHQFEKGKALSEELIAEYPNHAYNYGTLVDALVELGEYDRAVEMSDRMLSIKPSLASYARASYLRELHGDTDGAIEAMRMAADAGVSNTAERSWALYHLGNLHLAENKPDTAAFIFNGILEEMPTYTNALAGLAHVHTVKGEYDEALDLLNEAYASTPSEAYLEQMLETYQLTGNTDQIKATLPKIEEAFDGYFAMGENAKMEYADFLADYDRKLDEALQLAEEEYNRRPGHLHALETYAWTLHKNNRSAEAIPYIEKAMRLNTGDAMVHYRAGAIYQGAGQPHKAARQFQQALDANLHIESPSTAQEARALLHSLKSNA
ncbi:MAG TPA: tetratricopeptide repeat protein [Rhodothermales bacterium]|nr:tetratricopeptide repeat protein [Rhodothermales bacterium]